MRKSLSLRVHPPPRSAPAWKGSSTFGAGVGDAVNVTPRDRPTSSRAGPSPILDPGPGSRCRYCASSHPSPSFGTSHPGGTDPRSHARVFPDLIAQHSTEGGVTQKNVSTEGEHRQTAPTETEVETRMV